jgi:hypothetical protein
VTTTTGTTGALPQSLARGAAGAALLPIERALTGTGTWADAHAAITTAATGPIDASPAASLLHGAPALSFVLHAAQADGQPRYQAAARELTSHVHRIARQRLAALNERHGRGVQGAAFRQHDLFYGLTGIGVVLLRTSPGSESLADVLRYLVQLTQPRLLDGLEVPGWWADCDPDPLMPTPGGHANLGIAHGAAGILALVSLAATRGITVPGQRDAIRHLADWYARWRQDSPDGPWWPQWLTRDDLRTGHASQPGPGRPSWCYGTPGIARALQLAAIATGGRPEQAAAEEALTASLSERHLARTDGHGLCHGLAGIYMTALRAEQDAITPLIGRELPRLKALLASRFAPAEASALLTGDTGIKLALESARRSAPPISGWDACLAIT